MWSYKTVKRPFSCIIAVFPLAVALLSIEAFTTRRQLEVWRSELRLWQWSVESGVRWHSFHHNLGSALFNVDRFDEAAHHFQESLRLFETPLVHMAIGNMALKRR